MDRPAAREWDQHPTAETRRAFEQEKERQEIGRLGCSGVLFTILASATIFVYWLAEATPSCYILKRFGTALVMLIVLFPVLFFGSLVVGVVIVGSRAQASHDQSVYKNEKVGARFGGLWWHHLHGGTRDFSSCFGHGCLFGRSPVVPQPASAAENPSACGKSNRSRGSTITRTAERQ